MRPLGVPHPQLRLDVLEVKLCRLSHSFSSAIGREKKWDAEVDLLRVVNHILMPSSSKKSWLRQGAVKRRPTKPLQSPIRCRMIGRENGVLAIKADRLCEFLHRLVVLLQRKKYVALFLELDRLVFQGAGRRHGGGSI